ERHRDGPGDAAYGRVGSHPAAASVQLDQHDPGDRGVGGRRRTRGGVPRRLRRVPDENVRPARAVGPDTEARQTALRPAPGQTTTTDWGLGIGGTRTNRIPNPKSPVTSASLLRRLRL